MGEWMGGCAEFPPAFPFPPNRLLSRAPLAARGVAEWNVVRVVPLWGEGSPTHPDTPSSPSYLLPFLHSPVVPLPFIHQLCD